jgi:uncharacterized RDD family membrane protein YckC
MSTTSVPPPGFRPPPRPASGSPSPDVSVAEQPLRAESRRNLDGRRFAAAFIDNLIVGLPAWLVLKWQFGENLGTAVMAIAVVLVYHHLCEVTTGQTIGKRNQGLRVATWDGATPRPAPAAARNVVRLIEMPLIAAIVLVCSGKRRQRLGDLFASTIVIDARVHPVPPTQWRTSYLVYPVLWLAPALVVFALASQGKAPGTYRFEAERLCGDARREAARSSYRRSLMAQLGILNAEGQALARLKVPGDWAVRHRILMERRAHQFDDARRLAMASDADGRAAVHGWSLRVRAAAATDRRALEQLGFRACAGPGVV